MTEPLEVFLRLNRLHAELVRKFDRGLGGVHGLSFGDFMMLRQLERAPGGRLRRVDLADRLALSASGVTRALGPLERIGLVTRESNPRDARVGYAVLTEAGRERVGQALVTARAIGEELVAGRLTDQDRKLLADLLARLDGDGLVSA